MLRRGRVRASRPPMRTYARAFLRTYADALGLDADLFVKEFDARFPEEEEEEIAPPRPITIRRSHRFRRRGVAAVVGLAAIGGFVAWSNWSQHDSLPTVSGPPAAHAAPPPKQHRVLAAHHTVVAPPKHFPLVIRATTGECWLLVRRGNANGPLIYEGLLEPGKSLSFGPRVWVRLGALSNVAVHRGTHVVAGLPASRPVNLTA